MRNYDTTRVQREVIVDLSMAAHHQYLVGTQEEKVNVAARAM